MLPLRTRQSLAVLVTGPGHDPSNATQYLIARAPVEPTSTSGRPLDVTRRSRPEGL